MNPTFNPGSAQDLVSAGYSGYQGWGNAEAIADFRATGGSGKGGQSATGSNLFSNVGAQPTFDLIGATNAAYNTPEITSANQAVTDANTELTGRQQALATAQAGINDNPFYSEATRVGKAQQLTQQANNDMQIIQTKQTQAEQKVASLKSDAAIKVAAAQGQYNINEQAYQNTIAQFNTILSAGGLTYADPNTLASYAAATGINLGALQSIQKQEQQNNVKTQVIPSTDNNGNVTLTTVDSVTGKIVNQTTAGQISTSQKVTGTASANAASAKQNKSSVISDVYDTFRRIAGPQGYVSKEDWAKMKSAVLSSGVMNASEFNSEFASFTNPNGAKAGYIYN